MTDQINQHVPSPEFRASLEREVVQAFRRQSQFSAPPSVTRRARVRTVAALVLGLALGAGGVVASAQVQNKQQRDSLLTATDFKRMMQSLRLEIANANLQEVMKSVKVGVRPQSDAYDAQHEVMAAQYLMKRIDIETAEIHVSGVAPRDELWAPLLAGRDFVSERLKIDAGIATDRLAQAEQRLQTMRVRQLAGLVQDGSDEELEANAGMQVAESDFKLLTRKLDLRTRFLDGKVSEKELTATLQLMEVQNALSKAAMKMQQAAQRAKRAKERATVGIGSQLDVKRAELQALDTTADLQRLQEQLRKLEALASATRKP